MTSHRSSKRLKKTNTNESPAPEISKNENLINTGEEKSPLVVFAHGAGAPSTSDWMIRWKAILKEALAAVEVVTFDYPYLSGGKRKAPPKAEKLVEYHLNIVKDSTKKFPGHPLILAGKSMGSRVSCMAANACEDLHVSAIICLGYPLKGAKGVLRDEILMQLTAQTIFVQGSKDGLCPLEKLETTRKKMKCKNELHAIDGGDHSFKIGKKFLDSNGITQDEAESNAAKAIAEFVSQAIITND